MVSSGYGRTEGSKVYRRFDSRRTAAIAPSERSPILPNAAAARWRVGTEEVDSCERLAYAGDRLHLAGSNEYTVCGRCVMHLDLSIPLHKKSGRSGAHRREVGQSHPL